MFFLPTGLFSTFIAVSIKLLGIGASGILKMTTKNDSLSLKYLEIFTICFEGAAANI